MGVGGGEEELGTGPCKAKGVFREEARVDPGESRSGDVVLRMRIG